MGLPKIGEKVVLVDHSPWLDNNFELGSVGTVVEQSGGSPEIRSGFWVSFLPSGGANFFLESRWLTNWMPLKDDWSDELVVRL